MKRTLFKTLTLSILQLVVFSPLSAKVLEQEKLKTHIRWSISSPRKQILIKKEKNTFTLQTLNRDFFNSLVEDISQIEKEPNYIKSIDYSIDGFPEKPATVTVQLEDDSIELFSFFKEAQQRYIVDFWINQDKVVVKKAAPVVKNKTKVKSKDSAKKVLSKNNKKKKIDISKSTKDVVDPKSLISSTNNPQYRDFRYGASFVWDYDAFIPPLKSDINIKNKSPDFLYRIEDMKSIESKIKSHMQLNINFYRQLKWGLMNKSLTLFDKRYKNHPDYNRYNNLNDFMRANSLIKNTIKERVSLAQPGENEDSSVNISSNSTINASYNILKNIVERTNDYELKQACLRYLLQASINGSDYITSLQIAKNLYVASSEAFDDDNTKYSANVILHSLARFNQFDKIKEFLQNKAVQRLLPAQVGKSYLSYVLLKQNNTKDLIKDFEANEAAYQKPVARAILYNTAEAYFRRAKYEKAIKLFDRFLANYSGASVTSNAYLRMALSYDLLDRPVAQTLALYKTAINRSSKPEISYESKVRYVGLAVARKIEPSPKEIETISFLQKTKSESDALNENTKKLLWLTRLRTFISQGQYDKALSYLSSLPLEKFSLEDRQAFQADGAEIVLGVIKDLYFKREYSKAVKTWEVYKGKYEDKVAQSPYVNFIIAESYLNLSLNKSFERTMKRLETLKESKVRSYPNWVDLHKDAKASEYLAELKLLSLINNKRWEEAKKFLSEISNEHFEHAKSFYRGYIAYKLSDYSLAVKYYEKTFTDSKKLKQLSPSQRTDLINSYVEALYQMGDHAKFRKIASSVLKDFDKVKNSSEVKERVLYLLIESYFSDQKIDDKKVVDLVSDFKNEFNKSAYMNRIEFIKGKSLIGLKKVEQGKKVLTELIGNDDVPEYLKGLARSELTSLKIRTGNKL